MDGRNCVMYVNTASSTPYATPTWTPVRLAKDVDLKRTRQTGDSSCRAYEHGSKSPGQIECSVTSELVHRPTDAAIVKLLAALDAGTTVDLFFCDPPGGAGAAGKRGDFYVTDLSRKEPLNGPVTLSFAAELTTDDDHELVSYTYPA